MNDLHLGFKVERLLAIQPNWKQLEINATVPLAHQRWCPAEGKELKTICTLVGSNGQQRLKIGLCPACGYLGYITRPTSEWMEKFYLETWDDAQVQGDFRKMEKLKRQYETGTIGKEGEVIPLVKKFILNKDCYICEIGCGYGKMLKQINLLGFKRLVGVENSRHRAEIARKVYALEVLTGPFESRPIQGALKKKGPFGLIFAYHVLEHVYNPAQTIQAASQLQNEGDYLIISTPNSIGEASMGTLLFLPHLHSFTQPSLKKLLQRYNYVVVDNSLTTNKNINIVARKVKFMPWQESNRQKDYFTEAVAKFTKGLALEKLYPYSPRRFWWFRKDDIGGQTRFYPYRLLEQAHWYLVSKLGKYQLTSSLLVSNLTARYTSLQESSLEIQFKDNIKLFYK